MRTLLPLRGRARRASKGGPRVGGEGPRRVGAAPNAKVFSLPGTVPHDGGASGTHTESALELEGLRVTRNAGGGSGSRPGRGLDRYVGVRRARHQVAHASSSEETQIHIPEVGVAFSHPARFRDRDRVPHGGRRPRGDGILQAGIRRPRAASTHHAEREAHPRSAADRGYGRAPLGCVSRFEQRRSVGDRHHDGHPARLHKGRRRPLGPRRSRGGQGLDAARESVLGRTLRSSDRPVRPPLVARDASQDVAHRDGRQATRGRGLFCPWGASRKGSPVPATRRPTAAARRGKVPASPKDRSEPPRGRPKKLLVPVAGGESVERNAGAHGR